MLGSVYVVIDSALYKWWSAHTPLIFLDPKLSFYFSIWIEKGSLKILTRKGCNDTTYSISGTLSQ